MGVCDLQKEMTKERILEILESAKDDRGSVPMALVRLAFDKLPESCKDVRDINVGKSRKAAIDLCDWYEDSLMREALEKLPSAQLEHNSDDERKIADWHKMVNYLLSQSEQKWIPCSERLPDSTTNVIVSCHKAYEDASFDYVSCGWFNYKGGWTLDLDDNIDSDVIAWMPLPDPWKGDAE